MVICDGEDWGDWLGLAVGDSNTEDTSTRSIRALRTGSNLSRFCRPKLNPVSLSIRERDFGLPRVYFSG